MLQATGVFGAMVSLPTLGHDFSSLWIHMDIVFGQLHLLMLGTELEAVPADTVSFELCSYSYLRASCVYSIVYVDYIRL